MSKLFNGNNKLLRLTHNILTKTFLSTYASRTARIMKYLFI